MDRRNFLKGSVATGLGILAASTLLSQIPVTFLYRGTRTTKYFSSVATLRFGDVVSLDRRTGGISPTDIDSSGVVLGVVTGPNEIMLRSPPGGFKL